MASGETRNFRYLNAAGAWPGFSFAGLQLRDDGTLALSALARLEGAAPAGTAALAPPHQPGGVASDCDGNFYWSDPDRNRVFCRRACDGSIAPLTCLERRGADAGPLRAPRGLVVSRARGALFIADSGNSRILAVDLASQQLLEVWPRSAARNPAAGPAPDAFNKPWGLAADAGGNVFVLDHGNRCVQKIRATGDRDDRFFANVTASGLLSAPSDIAVTVHAESIRVLIADSGASRIVFFDADGRPELDSTGAPLYITLDRAIEPMGLEATPATLFLGDNGLGRILQIQITDGSGFGSATDVRGYHGPVSALALASADTLLAYPGSGVAPIEIAIGNGFLPLGAAWSRAIDLGYPVRWRELVAELAPLEIGSHLDVFAHASDDPNDEPRVREDPTLRTFFADPRWERQVRGSTADVTAVYIGNAQATTPAAKQRYLWVGVEFRSEGGRSAVLENLRVEFNQDGYLALLPAIYAAAAPTGDFLPRLLALFQGFFEGVESEIAGLPLLFDPALAPPALLDWLAGWLGVELDELWPESKRRAAIADGFAWFARRGTPKGLEHAIQFAIGVPAVVEEPAAQTGSWCLPDGADACCADCAGDSLAMQADASTEDSVLGWTTVLAASQPDGAVVGSTAVLDQSQLIRDDQFGAPLFSDVAYQFSVLVPRSALACPASLARLRSIVESAMPAHTAYQICAIDPLMRLGYQSRVGVDTIVAGPPPSMRLGEEASLGATATLGGPAPALVGHGARVGIGARIE